MTNSTLVKTDSGGDVELYLTKVAEYAAEYEEYNPPDEERRNSEYFTALLHHIYRKVFKPTAANRADFERNTYYNKHQNSILNYENIEGLDRIFDAYIDLCGRYKQIPTILGFCSMCGVDKDTVTTWANGTSRNINSDSHLRTAKKWLKICESALAQRAIMSNSIGSIFALKSCYQWRETAPIPPETESIPVHDTADQIAARHATARLPEKPVFDMDD